MFFFCLFLAYYRDFAFGIFSDFFGVSQTFPEFYGVFRFFRFSKKIGVSLN